MTRKHWIYAILGTVVLLAIFAWAFAPRPVEVETGTARLGRFEAGVEEDGKTRLRDNYVVSAPLAGLLTRITLKEGDRVEAGANVAMIRPAYAPLQDERTLREQQARLAMTRAQVDRVNARAEAAQVALRRARNDLARSETLAGQGFVAASRLESERLAALAAQKELDAARAERAIAGHEVEQARAALMAVSNPASVSGRGLAVRAPVAGRVLRVVQASEAVVPFGTPLLELGDLSTLEVVAELLTADALQAQAGSPVVITRWGGAPLAGRVRRVEPAAFTKISALGVEEQRVRVLIDIASPPEAWQALGVGYRVNVRIVTLAQDQVLKIPVSAVFPIPQGNQQGRGMAVYVVDGDRARLTPVELGARNDAEAWVRAGLAQGARVIIYPGAQVADGVRVKVRSTAPAR